MAVYSSILIRNFNVQKYSSFRNSKLIRIALKIAIITTLIGYFTVASINKFHMFRDTNQNKDWGKCCRSNDKENTFVNICGDSECSGLCPSVNYEKMINIYPGRMFGDIEKDRVFFIESSGAADLNARQACSIESFARLHPDKSVYVLMVSEEKTLNSNKETKMLNKFYKNVTFIRLDLNDYIGGSPLEKWYYCNKDWRQDPRRADHLSDGLRLLTLYNYGGYYFDMDFLFLRPVPKYKRFLVSQSSTSLTNSAMHYNTAQSTLFKMALTDFAQNFKANKFGFNGPHLINRVFQKWCSHENVTLMRPDGYQIHFSQSNASCEGVHILPEELFHPPATHFSLNWKENALNQKPLIDSYGSKTIAVRLFSDVYRRRLPTQHHNERLAENFCPIVFSQAPPNSF